MTDDTMSKAEKIDLLRRACDVHQTLYRDAMAGKGLDRHMFGLYVACKGLGYVSRQSIDTNLIFQDFSIHWW